MSQTEIKNLIDLYSKKLIQLKRANSLSSLKLPKLFHNNSYHNFIKRKLEKLNSLNSRNKYSSGEKRIKQDLIKRSNKIKAMVEEISQNSTGLMEEYVVKLKERIKEILKTDIVDEQRLAQETVIFADKSSIQEELTRLDSHIHQFETILLNSNGSIGKKIDFLIQEMNREINTIGSKSGSLEITNLVVDVKTELEDIREQVQNLE